MIRRKNIFTGQLAFFETNEYRLYRPTFTTPSGSVYESRRSWFTLDSLVEQGKVREVGFKFKPYDFSLLQSFMHKKLVTNQIEISIMSNDCFTNGDLAFMQEKRLPIMAWSPLAGGKLFDSGNKF